MNNNSFSHDAPRRSFAAMPLVLLLLLLVIAPPAPVAASGPLPQEIYLWQRKPPADLSTSLAATREKVSGLSLLAAEVAWENGRPTVWHAQPDWTTLRGDGRPLTLVLRVGPWPGKFSRDSAECHLLCEIATRLIADARSAQVEPAELQIDFDCAQAKLAGYRIWLGALKETAGNVPLGFTALPVWLGEPAFPELARSTGRYVLQVHSLEKPKHADAAFSLCDPSRALAWVEKAAALGVPFRIALPTYGYEVAFDSTGRFLGIGAERPRVWPADAQLRPVAADPAGIAALVSAWQRTPPPHCTGLIWFRLPVANELHNWPMATLLAVMEGRIPNASVAAELRWHGPTLAELVVANTGETLLSSLPAISTASAQPPLAADAIAGYVRRGHLWTPPAAKTSRALAPGERRVVGWLRFASATNCTASLHTP